MPRSRKRAAPLDEQPRYREAYPRFHILHAAKAFKQGHSMCEFTDRFEAVVGVARFSIADRFCQLDYQFRSPLGVSKTESARFELNTNERGRVKHRYTIVCPSCKINKDVLFFNETWACALCLNLTFRSQQINPLARKWESFDFLDELLKCGKPHGMQNVTYAYLKLKLHTVKDSLDGKRRYFASDKYSEVIGCSWRAPLPRDGISFPTNDVVNGRADSGPVRSEPAGLNPATGSGLENGQGVRFEGGFETDDPDDL